MTPASTGDGSTTAPTTGAPWICGDGQLDPGEECDDGPDNGLGRSCKPDCAFNVCGDDILGPDEECDEGPDNANDATCTLQCRINVCGDGLVQEGVEQCDEGPSNGDDKPCRLDCKLQVCGDGLVGPGEECDDGNTRNDDGCTDACALPSCGDGLHQPSRGEECDDGNQIDTDACTSACKQAKCGDGFVQPSLGENCDDGNTLPNDGCSPACFTGCKEVAGIRWCYDPTACGQACNAVCQANGRVPLADQAKWLQAQDTEAECEALAAAFGIVGATVEDYTYGCLEDEAGNHTNQLFLGPLHCSTFAGCPLEHLQGMDELGVPCDGTSRRSICPCE